jgi:hypothetical protein
LCTYRRVRLHGEQRLARQRSPGERAVLITQLCPSLLWQGRNERRELGLCLMVYHEATRRLGGRSGEIAANRVLDLERLGLPHWLFAGAQPRLGRRPAGAAVLADQDNHVCVEEKTRVRPRSG